MTKLDTQDRSAKFLYFLLGATLPLAAYFVWSRGYLPGGGTRKKEIDRAHDITVEDSFPASDPPSAW
jgi:hypothetical protein